MRCATPGISSPSPSPSAGGRSYLSSPAVRAKEFGWERRAEVRAPALRVLAHPCPPRRYGGTFAGCGQYSYLFGGAVPEGFFDDLWRFDNARFTWALVDRQVSDGVWPSKRKDHSAVCWKGSMYVFGGEASDGTSQVLTNDTFVLDTVTECWSLVPGGADGPAPRYKHATCVVKNQMLVYGGGDANGHVFDDVWALDLETKVWSCLSPQTGDARCNASMTTVDGRVLVFGGFRHEDKRLGDVLEFDFASRSFVMLHDGNGPEDRTPPARASHGAVCRDGILVVYGGNSTQKPFRDVWEFDLVGRKWRCLDTAAWPSSVEDRCGDSALFPTSRFNFCMGNISNSRNVFVGFGRDSVGGVLDDCWVLSIDMLRNDVCQWPVDGIVVEKVERMLCGFVVAVQDETNAHADSVFRPFEQKVLKDVATAHDQVERVVKVQAIERDERKRLERSFDAHVSSIDCRITTLDSNIRAEIATTKDALTVEFDNKLTTESQSIRSALSSGLSDLQVLLTAQFEAKLAEERELRSSGLQELSDRMSANQSEMKQMLSSLESQLTAKIDDGLVGAQRSLLDVETRLKVLIAEREEVVRGDCVKSLASLHQELQEAISAISASCTAEVSRLESLLRDIQAECRQSDDSIRSDVQAVRSQLTEDIQVLRTETLQSASALEQRLSSQIDEKHQVVSERISSEVQNLHVHLEASLEKCSSSVSAVRVDLDSVMQTELPLLRTTVEDYNTTLREHVDVTVSQISKDMEGSAAALRSYVDDSLSSRVSPLENRCDTIEKTAEGHQQQVDGMRAHIASESDRISELLRKEMLEKNDAVIASTSEMVTTALSPISSSLSSLQVSMDTLKAETQTSFDVLSNDVNTKLESVSKSLESLQTDVDAKLEEERRRLSTSVDEATAAVSKQCIEDLGQFEMRTDAKVAACKTAVDDLSTDVDLRLQNRFDAAQASSEAACAAIREEIDAKLKDAHVKLEDAISQCRTEGSAALAALGVSVDEKLVSMDAATRLWVSGSLEERTRATEQLSSAMQIALTAQMDEKLAAHASAAASEAKVVTEDVQLIRQAQDSFAGKFDGLQLRLEESIMSFDQHVERLQQSVTAVSASQTEMDQSLRHLIAGREEVVRGDCVSSLASLHQEVTDAIAANSVQVSEKLSVIEVTLQESRQEHESALSRLSTDVDAVRSDVHATSSLLDERIAALKMSCVSTDTMATLEAEQSEAVKKLQLIETEIAELRQSLHSSVTEVKFQSVCERLQLLTEQLDSDRSSVNTCLADIRKCLPPVTGSDSGVTAQPDTVPMQESTESSTPTGSNTEQMLSS